MISLKTKIKNKGKTLKEYLHIKKKIEKPPTLDESKIFAKKKKCKCKSKKKK